MSKTNIRLLLLLALGTLSLSHLLLAEGCGLERDLSSSAGEVEGALRIIKAYSGDRLPTLEGFAGSSEAPLSLFKRGYYQYSLQVIPLGDARTRVRVCAKITAWLDAADSRPGYRQLSSNGRLEADLLDRLRDAINTMPLASATMPLASATMPPASAQASSTTLNGPAQPAPSNDGSPTPRPEVVPGTAARPQPAVGADTFTIPKASAAKTAAISPYASVPAASGATPLDQRAEERAVEALTLQARGLEQVLSNQTYPKNLVSVLRTNSPVMDRPAEGARVLLYANAEDEFQQESESGGWVQVQISGTSRGWIRRSLLEAPARSDPSPASTRAPREHASGIANKDATGGNGNGNDTIDKNTADKNTAGKDLGKDIAGRGITEQISLFPGKWQPLDGKQVKVISVEPSASTAVALSNKKSLSTSVFRKAYQEISKSNPQIAGVVIIFDAADGLMAAATKESLQQWELGHLSNSAFWKQCYLDPKDAFKATE